MLRRESGTERGSTDTCHITPKSTLPGRHSRGRKGSARRLTRLSQTRVVISRSPLLLPIFQTLHHAPFHSISLKSATTMTSGRCSSTLHALTPLSPGIPKMFRRRSLCLLRPCLATIPPVRSNLFLCSLQHNFSLFQPPWTFQPITPTFSAPLLMPCYPRDNPLEN